MMKLKFSGMSVSKEVFESRYQVELSEYEWKQLAKKVSESWEASVSELRLLAFKHIRSSMEEMGYKVELKGNEVGFQRSESLD